MKSKFIPVKVQGRQPVVKATSTDVNDMARHLLMLNYFGINQIRVFYFIKHYLEDNAEVCFIPYTSLKSSLSMLTKAQLDMALNNLLGRNILLCFECESDEHGYCFTINSKTKNWVCGRSCPRTQKMLDVRNECTRKHEVFPENETPKEQPVITALK